MGILLTLGRMSSDVEIIAFKASGIGLRQLFRPIFVVAFLAYVFTTVIMVYVAPQATQALKRHLFDIARTRVEVGLKERIFNTEFNDTMIYVNKIEPQSNRLQGILISLLASDRSEEPTTIVAQEGYFVSNLEKLELYLYLTKGSIHNLNRKSNEYQEINFTEYNLNLDLQQANAAESRKRIKKEEMFTHQLLSTAVDYLSEGDKDDYYALLVEFHSRLAVPCMCILFGLIGVPLGVYSPRTGRAYGFIVGLFVILLYYVLFSFGRNLGGTGVAPPIVALWVPNLIFLVLSLYIFRKVATESPISLLEHLVRAAQIVRQKFIFLVERKRPIDPMLTTLIEDLNKDNAHMLVLKLGVDDALAGHIVTYRNQQGSIKDIEDLRNVPGIDEIIYEKIKENTMG